VGCPVVAVVAPGRPLQVAWCGDSRAYLLDGGLAVRLTEDHNLRRVYPPCAVFPEGGNRNMITSCLGSGNPAERVEAAISDYGGRVVARFIDELDDEVPVAADLDAVAAHAGRPLGRLRRLGGVFQPIRFLAVGVA
jgi:serine/threonine protein phosphatase PrpC